LGWQTSISTHFQLIRQAFAQQGTSVKDSEFVQRSQRASADLHLVWHHALLELRVDKLFRMLAEFPEPSDLDQFRHSSAEIRERSTL